MDDLHDDDDRTPARVRVPVDGVKQRLGDGLKEVFGRAVQGLSVSSCYASSNIEMRRLEGRYLQIWLP
jgi:hypothetical protein